MRDLIQEYRDLLGAEESVEALDRSLRLVELASDLAVRFKAPNFQAERIEQEHRADDAGWRALPDYVQERDERQFEEARQRRLRTKARLRQQARVWRVFAVLSWLLPTLSESGMNLPEEQESLLRDALLLVFHHAFFALLPALGTDDEQERDALLKAFESFAAEQSSLAERCRVLGLVALERGTAPEALRHFALALAATHVDEHDYMTRLQTLWSELLDQGRVPEAFELLLDTYPRIPREHLDEMADLMRSTLRAALRRRRAS